MKKFGLYLLLAGFCFTVHAQQLFVRAYDSKGMLILKGRVTALTDSSMYVKKANGNTLELLAGSIGWIKTKRTTGHYLLVSTLISSTVLAVLGAATAKSSDDTILGYSPGAGALAGAVVGILPGGLFGGLGAALKKTRKFVINNNVGNWGKFQQFMTDKYQY